MWDAIRYRGVCAEIYSRVEIGRLQWELRRDFAHRITYLPLLLSLRCAESYYVDVDMANAHPQLLMDLIVEKSPNSPTQALGRYCANYPLWRKAISEYSGCIIEDAKREITKYSTEPAHSANSPS